MLFMHTRNLFRDCCNDLMILVCLLIIRRVKSIALFARRGVAKCGVWMLPTYRGSEIDVVLGSVFRDVRQFTEEVYNY